MPNPFASLDAVGQAELVRSEAASPSELVNAAIDAIDATSDLNAVIHRRDERARAEARAVAVGEQPFAGVPIVVKDLDGFLADEPYHAGSRHLRDHGYVADHTSELIARLQRAGFVIIGKTNTPELGLIPSTEPATYGPTHNPWDTSRTPGGSSGGSAAAVAAGIVPVAHAGDGGGSIRIPAGFCGLVGLKPSRGRVTLGPIETEAWAGLVARHVVSRTVRDCAAVLDVVAGPLPGDPYRAPDPARLYVEELERAPRRLRIGWTTATGDGSVVDAQVAAAVRRAAEVAATLGHEVTEATDFPSTDEALVTEMTTHFLTVWPVWTAGSVDQFAAWTGVAPTADTLQPHTWALAELGRTVTATAYAAGIEGLRSLSRRIVSWWDGNDVLLTPTVGRLPPVLGGFEPTAEDPMAGVMRASEIVTFCIPFNITGQPAISLPLGEAATDGGTGPLVPVGVQAVAAPYREDLLIALAAQLETALPWSDRRPQVWAG